MAFQKLIFFFFWTLITFSVEIRIVSRPQYFLTVCISSYMKPPLDNFPAFYGTRIHYRTHKRSPLVPILNQTNSALAATCCLSRIHLNIIRKGQGTHLI
jgi:hypothetical protein